MKIRASNDYPDAGDGAAPEVQDAIDRFLALPEEEQDPEVLLYWLIGPHGTQPFKASKEYSEYVEQAEGVENCGNCRHFWRNALMQRDVCAQIRGDDIKVAGWCKFWEGKDASEE